MSHSELSPSSSDRWLFCTASVPHNRGVPDTDSMPAMEGTACHLLIEQAYIDGQGDAEHLLGDVIEIQPDDPDADPVPFTVDRDMVNAARKWLDKLEEIREEAPEVSFLIEQKLDLSDAIRPGESGTSDAIGITRGRLHVLDFKYGYAIVTADRPQLKLYALGAVDAVGWEYDFESVVLHIVQPRAHHYDRVEISVEELEAFRSFIHTQVRTIDTDDAEYQYTEHGCKYCAIKDTCEARARGIAEDVANVFPEVSLDGPEIELGNPKAITPIDANQLSNDQLARLLTVRKAAEDLFSSAHDEALKRRKNGDEIPGFKAVLGRGSKAWDDEAEVEKAFKRKKIRIDDFAPRKMITPAKAEELYPGKKGAWIKDLYTKSSGAPKLVPATASGKAIEYVAREDAFPDGSPTEETKITAPSIFDELGNDTHDTTNDEENTYEWE